GHLAALVAAAALILTFVAPAYAGAGDLDPTFGRGGRVTTDFTPHGDIAGGVAIQADGRIVIVGTAGYFGSNPKFALARYRPNGSLDTSFGGDGRVTTDFTVGFDGANGVAIQADGKLVAAGQSGGSNAKLALARYRP